MLKRNLELKEASGSVGARKGVVPGVVVVRWKPNVVGRRMSMARASAVASALPEQVTDPLAFLRRNYGLKRVVDLSPDEPAPGAHSGRHALGGASLAVARSLSPDRGGLQGVTILEFAEKADTRRIARLIGKGNAVEFAQPAPARWAAGRRVRKADPSLNGQWGLTAIDWFNARRRSASDIRVAILDSGVDRKHPDLKAAVSQYHAMGFSQADLVGHGTHVAGIIAATANNDIGIAGVADCRLACWKIFKDDPAEDVDNESYYRALEAAGRQRGVKVINLSIGGVEEDRLEVELIKGLVGKDDVVIVAAMGNEYAKGNPTEYPAAIPGVLAVGAMSANRRRAGFSNTGNHIALVAPGTSILSTLPMKASSVRGEVEYEAWDGTSMATPFVSGAAALIFARHPDWSAKKVKNKLMSQTLPLPAMNGKSWTSRYGSGVLNVRKALSS